MKKCDKIECSCSVCNKILHLIPSRIKKYEKHYCSTKCQHESMRKPKKEIISNRYRTSMDDNHKRKLTHRLIIENELGITLDKSQVVHHINGNKLDNRPENLTIMSRAEHSSMHSKKHPSIKICLMCKKEYSPPYKHRGRSKFCGRDCYIKYIRNKSEEKNEKV